MMFLTRTAILAITVVFLPTIAGCGGGSDDTKQNLNQQASAKLDAMKQLAEAVGRNASPGEVNGIAESFVSNNLDVKARPEEARQIIEIYNAKVKGKLKGEQAGQVKSIVEGIENEMKK